MTKRTTPRSRDRNRLAVAVITGAATAASLTVTGWIIGVAATDFEAEKAEREAAQAKADRQRARYELQVARTQQASGRPLLQRPARTRVITRYVRVGADQAVGGGDLRAPVQTAAGNSSGSATSDPSSPALPPPPPPPASTSGS